MEPTLELLVSYKSEEKIVNLPASRPYVLSVARGAINHVFLSVHHSAYFDQFFKLPEIM